MRVRVTRRGLRKWALSQPEGSVVGRARTVTSCPVAHYLQYKGVRIPTVNHQRYYNGEGYSEMRPDSTVSAIIQLVDTVQVGDMVTRETFLDILDSVDEVVS